MALINCPECNKEISDKAVACPNCGCPASEFAQQPEDTRSEVDKIADEIFWEKPNRWIKNPKLLARRAGISVEKAKDMMNIRLKEYHERDEQGELPDTQYCPYCGSIYVEPFEFPGTTVTSKANILGGMYITSSSPSKMWMRCNTCKCKWIPKKKK